MEPGRKISVWGGRLFQGKINAFLSKTTNKESVINIIAAKTKKLGYNLFHSYDDDDYDDDDDDANIDFIKLAI